MRPAPGTYALVFKTQRNKRLVIGKLGTLNLQPGYYVYVGSAFGPGGLKARIGHHRKTFSRPHWHIDYLSEYLTPAEVWYTYDATHREDHWSQVLANVRGASIPLPGFGSSDCGCPSHLFFYQSPPSGRYFSRRLRSRFQDHTGFHTAKSKNFLTNSA